MCLEEKIDSAAYKEKTDELSGKIKQLLIERQDYVEKQQDEENLKKRTKEFKSLLEKNQVLEEFDRGVFESIVEKVIVGEINEEGNVDPYKLTFVYKTGISNKVDSKMGRKKLGDTLKGGVKKLCSSSTDEVAPLDSLHSADTCGDMRPLDENKRSVVRGLEAQSFWRAEREQNFLEPCQGALATQRSISTDHAIAVHDWRAQSAKTEWKQRTAKTCLLSRK